MKSYRFVGEEAEALGQRLDHARSSLENSVSPWSKNYWKQVVDQLLLQWKSLPILHDSDAQMTIIPRWNIDYDYYEKNEYTGHGVADRFYEQVFKRDANLDESWERHRAERLSRAQQ